MIPVALPSSEFVLILLAALVATLVWMVWALRLTFDKQARSRLRGWRGPLFLLLAGIAVYVMFSAYALRRDFNAFAAEQQEIYHPILEHAQTLGRIAMPSGTKLRLAVPRQPAAFDRAEFPHPLLVGGVNALLAERYLRIHTDESYQTTGFTPQNLRLTGVGESQQAGWRCDATSVIVFETHPDGTIKAFQSCRAGAGNLIEGQPLPKAAEIVATEGRLYLDGRRGLDRWIIYVPQDASMQIDGVDQKGGALLLDADRKVIERIEP